MNNFKVGDWVVFRNDARLAAKGMVGLRAQVTDNCGCLTVRAADGRVWYALPELLRPAFGAAVEDHEYF